MISFSLSLITYIPFTGHFKLPLPGEGILLSLTNLIKAQKTPGQNFTWPANTWEWIGRWVVPVLVGSMRRRVGRPDSSQPPAWGWRCGGGGVWVEQLTHRRISVATAEYSGHKVGSGGLEFGPHQPRPTSEQGKIPELFMSDERQRLSMNCTGLKKRR